MKTARLLSPAFIATTAIVGTSIHFVSIDAFTSPPSIRTIQKINLHPPPAAITRHKFHFFYPSIQTHHRQSSDNNNNNDALDPLLLQTSQKLKTSAFLSWWSQLILTVVSSVTFLFARNVLQSTLVSSYAINTPIEMGRIATKFALPGIGILSSILSIFWTWGGRRLAKRILRRSNVGRIETANSLRRLIKVGCTLNLIGLGVSLIGAQYIAGTLVAKAMQSVVVGNGVGSLASQTLQPLDVLVVQANTNVLMSHFVSLGCLLWLTRMVDVLDPPSLEEDS